MAKVLAVVNGQFVWVEEPKYGERFKWELEPRRGFFIPAWAKAWDERYEQAKILGEYYKLPYPTKSKILPFR